jgi:dolichol-phosphate mannosyltransferase
MDADNTHTPGLIFRMVQAVSEGNDVVIASRYRYGARVRGLSASRRLLSLGSSWLFGVVFPIGGVRDYMCGFRGYRARLRRRAFRELGPDRIISERGFACMVDILLKIREFDPIVTEVPLILRYDQKKGASKMRVGRTVRETLHLMVRRRLGLKG